MWNDPDLNIDWKIKNPIISERDRTQLSFKEYLKDPKF
jgi:dTDP-4-dehydrorhamnose 3,5-epimerase